MSESANKGQSAVPFNKWLKKSTINFWVRHPTVRSLSGTVTLSVTMVRDVMARTFEPITRDCYYITTQAREILTNNLSTELYRSDELLGAEQALSDQAMRIIEYFETRIEQATLKLESAGYSLDETETAGELYETRVVTPMAKQWLDILTMADRYLILIDYLDLAGELADDPAESQRVKLTAAREARQTLLSLPKLATSRKDQIWKICSGVIEQRRQEKARRDAINRRRAKKGNLKKSQQDQNALAADESEPAVQNNVPSPVASPVSQEVPPGPSAQDVDGAVEVVEPLVEQPIGS